MRSDHGHWIDFALDVEPVDARGGNKQPPVKLLILLTGSCSSGICGFPVGQ